MAYNHTYKTKFFEDHGGSYKEVQESLELHNLLGRKYGWYIVGTGMVNYMKTVTCKSIKVQVQE